MASVSSDMSNLIHRPHTRRGLIRSLTVTAAAFSAKGAFAEALTPTARLTEGPYYPDKMPLDTDTTIC